MSKYTKELKKNRFKNILDPEDYSTSSLPAVEAAEPAEFEWKYYYICYDFTPYGKSMTDDLKFFRQKKCNNRKELRSLLSYLMSDPHNSNFAVYTQKVKYGKLKQI